MEQSIPILLGAAGSVATKSSTLDVLIIVLIGFLFVLFVLLLLSFFTWSLGIFFKHLAQKKSQPATKAGAVSAGATVAGDVSLNPHEVVVITAAIHSVFGDRAHRVVSIRSGNSGWAEEGRRQIFTSRRVR